ncbi:putative disease resistance protein RGA3 [Ricinus communis]|uniref:Leucine-rich repeat-containing protein, putative n=1 Tax=Ricinus communis TaxID=3988 RepID=B9RGC6_RICCO|nr:putative disease resistance protein RGA3 [Ricinus communis]EEF49581.1 leucine-rich repeat-containing protein, putative [Ricinus communis]|eukprot:XP_002513078.1 putative disease resistance protein RGA3 [Ricinus communis]
MEVVGEAFLSAAFQIALGHLASPILREFGCRFGIDKDLRKLTRNLSKIQAVLNDAEAKQITDYSVKLWLNELKEVAYDADDVLDEVSTQAFRYNQQKKVTNLFSDFMFKYELAPKIKEINERLDEIAKQRNDLDLKEGTRVTLTETRDRDRLQTSSLIDESRVFGRTDDQKKLVELLVSDENSGNDAGVGVVPIIGMGGLGKTTLAQLVYNDPLVAEKFELKTWICVSDEFNVLRVTKSILESIERGPCNLVSLDILQTNLRDKLRGKKFLVVLDDVWNEKQRDWEVLRLPFRVGTMGSKIIVTTRNEKVASIMGTFRPHHLDFLSDDDCWLLFKQRAFVDGDETAHPNLVPIGKEIVKKCRGLPLAAKTLGGLLHAKTEVSEWGMILQSHLWELEEEKNEILPALRLSYNQLPAHLKQCFVFCSIFPKDHEFDKEDLVLLWMAEGFVHPKGRRRLEDVASDYFDDLLLRSFFQQSKTNLSNFVMHDLIHDLAESVAGEICFRLEGEKLQDIPENVRHTSVSVDKCKSVIYEALHMKKGLRTMLLLCSETSREVSNVKVLHDLISSLKCLRSLDMSHIAIKDLPGSVGDLMHMRYLNLSYTEIKELPDSICNLCNLQTLILVGCNKFLTLPKCTKDLVNLRHLNLTGCWHLKSMPPSFGKLTSLQRLHRFVVGKGVECGLNELKNMNELRDTLCIDRVEDVLNIEDAKEVSLKSKQYIHKLVLRWSRSQYSQDAIDEELLEYLEPHTNLRELMVDVYPGTRFPKWMGNSLLSHLESIEFIHCNHCKTLPPLGQLPFLKSLTISMMQELESIGREFYGEGKIKGFPSLKILKLEDMIRLKKWQEIDQGEFPVLQQLALLNCPNVINLPRFPALEDLLLDNCHETVLSSVHFLISVSSLKILNFRLTDMLPKGFLQPLAALKELKIQHFYRLKALQEEVGLQDLHSVQRLEIFCCPKLESFAERGLPSMLQFLSIGMCNNMKDLPNGLENLSSLQELNISNCCKLLSFKTLPQSLKNLRISACANLESLPTNLHELTNLEYLSIQSCQKLASLPVSGLPSCLRSLSIMECASLEERCAEGGEDWPKIQHIPKKSIRVF